MCLKAAEAMLVEVPNKSAGMAAWAAAAQSPGKVSHAIVAEVFIDDRTLSMVYLYTQHNWAAGQNIKP